MEPIVAWGAAATFALVHLLAGRLRFLEGVPRSRWLSMAGGAAVAYVFLHLLPELAAEQRHLEDLSSLGFIEERVYLVALIGLALFYGLERAAHASRRGGKGSENATEPGVFWLHVVSFGLYNLVVGYLLLHREEPGIAGLLWYALAMALHLLVNDYGLREHHKERYHRVGRWLLAAAVLAGWGVGVLVTVERVWLSLLFALLAGGVVLNTLKEELPAERESRFWAFAAGAALYAAVLLAS